MVEPLAKKTKLRRNPTGKPGLFTHWLKNIWAKWYWRVLLVWGATRVVTTTIFLWAASIQGQSYWNAAHPGYFDFLNIWDVEWYERIYDFGYGQLPGYPAVLPTDTEGNVQQNAWAFMPGFPMLVRLLNWVPQVDFKYASAITSTILSFVLALVIYKVFTLKFDAKVSLWGIAIFGLSVASPTLQTGYAETLGLVLLASGLYFLMQHRYIAAIPFLAAMSVTRPGMVAFAMMLAGMFVVRWIRARRKVAEFPVREQIQLIGLGFLSALFGFAWTLLAWAGTGQPDAYIATELAWRSWIPSGDKLVLLEPWFFAGYLYFGDFGWLVVLGTFGFAAWLMFSDSVKKLGNELRFWVGSYLLYLFLVFYPQSSTFRLLLPVFPLAVALAYRTRKWPWWEKAFLVIVEIAMMVIWVAICWVYVNPDYTPP